MIVALLAPLGLLMLPAVRDLPRRMIEARLTAAVAGEVSIGVLRLRRLPHLVLEDVRVGEAATLPWLRGARFPEVTAEARWGSLLRRRFDRLVVTSGSIELDARCDMALRLPEAATGLDLGELSVVGIDIGVHFAGGRMSAVGRLQVQPSPVAEGTWTGSWEVESDVADVETLVVLLVGEDAPACAPRDSPRRLVARNLVVEGELLDATGPGATGGALRGTILAEELGVEVGERQLTVIAPRFELDLGAKAPRRLEAAFELGPLGRGRLAAELGGDEEGDDETPILRTFEGEVRELDLGVLLPLVMASVAAAEGEATLRLGLADDGAGTLEGKAELSSLELSTAAGSGQLVKLEVETSGRVDAGQSEAFLTMKGRAARATFATTAGQILEAAALRLEGEGDVHLVETAPWVGLGAVSAEVGGRLDPWGEVGVTATLDPNTPTSALRGTWVWHGAELAALRAHLEEGEASGLASWEVGGRVDGSGGFAGSVSEPELWGQIAIEELRVESDELAAAFSAPAATLDLRRRAGGRMEARWSTGGEVSLGRLPAIPLQLEMAGEMAGTGGGQVLDLERGVVILGSDGALGTLRATATGRLGSSWSGSVRAEGAAPSAWAALLFPEATSPLEVSGRLAGQLSWELGSSAAGQWRATGSVMLEEGALASADGSRVLAPLEWIFTVDAGGEADRIAAHLTGEVGGFQMLWDAAFADYGGTRLPVVVDLEGSREAKRGSAWRLTAGADVDLGSGAAARGRLSRAPEGPMIYAFAAHAGELAPVLEELLRRPFAGGGGLFERIAGHGALDLELTGDWTESGGEVRGGVRAEGVGLVLGEGLSVEGLDLELPIDASWSVSEESEDGRGVVVRGPLRPGTIRFDGLEAAGLSVPATSASLEVEGEAVRLVDRLSVPLLGGTVVLRDLRLTAGLSGNGEAARLESAVQLDGLDLGRITETFDLFRLEGQVAGGFPHVVVSGGEMRTRGSGELDFFGGRATLDQVAVTELFSHFPRLTFNARFENLDLGQITRTLEFGEITGRVRGELRAVEVVGGTPVRFLGRIESVQVSEVPQRVSLKAANNLALLGTGTSGALGGGLLPRLFDRFPYVGLGMELALARDRFQLRGLLRRGDKELFLKGRLPLRLDVVNVRPGATVSFKTMMSRLGNLEIGRPGGSEDSAGRRPEAGKD